MFIPLFEEEDRPVWEGTFIGTLKLKEDYSFLNGPSHDISWAKMIWIGTAVCWLKPWCFVNLCKINCLRMICCDQGVVTLFLGVIFGIALLGMLITLCFNVVLLLKLETGWRSNCSISWTKIPC